MSGEHLALSTRRVLTGPNSRQRSTVVEDRATPTRIAPDAHIINRIRQMNARPPRVDVDHVSPDCVTVAPPAGGIVYHLVTTSPPDNEWTSTAGYDEALANVGAADAYVGDQEIARLHQTETIDIASFPARSARSSRMARSPAGHGTLSCSAAQSTPVAIAATTPAPLSP